MHRHFAVKAPAGAGAGAVRSRKPILSPARRRFVALLTACLLLALHTTGEAFHYLAHLPAVVSSHAVGIQTTVSSQDSPKRSGAPQTDAFHKRTALTSNGDHCALCSLNALGGTPHCVTLPVSTVRMLPITRSVVPGYSFLVLCRLSGETSPRGPPQHA